MEEMPEITVLQAADMEVHQPQAVMVDLRQADRAVDQMPEDKVMELQLQLSIRNLLAALAIKDHLDLLDLKVPQENQETMEPTAKTANTERMPNCCLPIKRNLALFVLKDLWDHLDQSDQRDRPVPKDRPASHQKTEFPEIKAHKDNPADRVVQEEKDREVLLVKTEDSFLSPDLKRQQVLQDLKENLDLKANPDQMDNRSKDHLDLPEIQAHLEEKEDPVDQDHPAQKAKTERRDLASIVHRPEPRQAIKPLDVYVHVDFCPTLSFLYIFVAFAHFSSQNT